MLKFNLLVLEIDIICFKIMATAVKTEDAKKKQEECKDNIS